MTAQHIFKTEVNIYGINQSCLFFLSRGLLNMSKDFDMTPTSYSCCLLAVGWLWIKLTARVGTIDCKKIGWHVKLWRVSLLGFCPLWPLIHHQLRYCVAYIRGALVRRSRHSSNKQARDYRCWQSWRIGTYHIIIMFDNNNTLEHMIY